MTLMTCDITFCALISLLLVPVPYYDAPPFDHRETLPVERRHTSSTKMH